MKRIFSLMLAFVAVQFAAHATLETIKVTTTTFSGSGSISNALTSAKMSEADTVKVVFEFSTRGKKVIRLEKSPINISLSSELIIDASTSKDSVVFYGGDKSIDGFQIASSTTLKGLTLMGFDDAVSVSSTSSGKINLYDCEFNGNNAGVHSNGNIENIDNCVFENNQGGLVNQGQLTNLTNCVFGLSRDQKSSMPNKYGVYMENSGNITNFSGNVFAENSYGIVLSDNSFIKGPITSCIFGVNKNNEYIDGGKSQVAIYSNAKDLHLQVDKCVFSYNQEALSLYEEQDGSGSATLTVTDCSFYSNSNGIQIHNNTKTPLKQLIVKGSTFAFTYYNNLYVNCCEDIDLEDNFFGSDGTHYCPFNDYEDGYAVRISPYEAPNYLYFLTVRNNAFYGNRGVSVGDVTPLSKSLFSDNLFYDTKLAYELPYDLPVPVISSAEKSGDDILIKGKIDTAAVATIELYYTDQIDQTAMEFVSSFSTLADGTFSVKVPNRYVGKRSVGFSATATYDENMTSELSNTTYLSFPIVSLSRTAYYVKVDGKGDGSSWEKAMGPQSFAYTLPRVGDNVTFYVAEGTYYPVYNQKNELAGRVASTFTVNSDISIKGGYPANAVTGSKSDPSKYLTIFSGDFEGDDRVDTVDLYNGSLYANDNSDKLFTVKPSVKDLIMDATTYDETDTENYFNMDGVKLMGATHGAIYGAGLNLKVNVTNSTFENAGFLVWGQDQTIVFDRCKFCKRGITQINNHKSLRISHSSFDEYSGFFSANETQRLASVAFESDTFIHCGKVRFECGTSEVKMTNCLVNDNSSYGDMFIVGCNDAKIVVSKCSFVGNRLHSSSLFNAASSSILLDSCSFVNNSIDLSMVNSGGISAKNCLFDSNGADWIFNNGYSALPQGVDIEKCAFINNSCIEGIGLSTDDLLSVKNSTFTGNKGMYLFSTDSLECYNNTIVGNHLTLHVFRSHSDEGGKIDLYGNIILGNGTSNDANIGYDNLPVLAQKKRNVEYNLMSIARSDYPEEGVDKTWTPDNSTNIFVRPFSLGTSESTLCKACASAYDEYEDAVLKSLFAGTYNSSTHIFKPKLDNSGYLPVMPLLTDTLADGTTLRFPLSKTIVKEDQRGVERVPNTCVGAYESGCSNDTIFMNDTISQGEKFLGVLYSVGVHDRIFERRETELGCDKLIMHKLVVTPEVSVKEYYVKTARSGKGDGSDWDNAMNCEDFAFILPLVADETKFYIAEGEYQPIYDFKGAIPTNTTDKVFYSTKCVSIYGGFPSTAKGTDLTSDPANHLTIFNGDMAHNNPLKYDFDEFAYGSSRTDDVRNILRLMPANSGSIEVSGIVFKNSRQSSSAGSACLEIAGSSSNKVFCDINKCTFTRGTAGLVLNSCSGADIRECIFQDNETGGSYAESVSTTTLRLEKNSFINIKGWHFVTMCKKAIIVNNTFAGTTYESNSISADSTYFMNNTVNGEIWINSGSYVNLVGNIINTDVAYYNAHVESSHNIYLDVNKDSTFVGESDILASAEDMKALLSDNTAYSGGFTPVIPLQNDKLTNGESIRFPLSETMVTEDQRGVARLDSTCMGAYEIGCGNDTTIKYDTIVVGEKFLDVTYTEFGRYDSIFETKTAVDGCENTVLHILYVKPDPSVLAYYVKTKSEGKGDGSSWENAMDGDDFAACLPLAPEGATFYVAEGRYVPKYGPEFSTDVSSYELCYEIKSSVTIRGGYPAGAKTGTVSNPGKYETIFDGDVLEDNIVGDSLKTDNISDDISCLFAIKNQTAANVSFDGVKIQNADCLVRSNNSQCELSLTRATLTYGKVYGVYLYPNSVLKVQNSKFENNTSYCICSDGSPVELRNVSFENNFVSSVIRIGSIQSVSVFDSLSLISNTCDSRLFELGSNITLTNSDLIDNHCRMLISCDNYGSKPNRFENCRLRNNKMEYYFANQMSMDFVVENCLVENNISMEGSPALQCGNYYGNGNVFRNNTFNYAALSCDTVMISDSKIEENKFETNGYNDLLNSKYAVLKRDTVENNTFGTLLGRFNEKGFLVDSSYINNNIGQVVVIDKDSENPVIYRISDSKIINNISPWNRDDTSLVHIEATDRDSFFIYRTEISDNHYKLGFFQLYRLNVIIDQSQIRGNEGEYVKEFDLFKCPDAKMEINRSSISDNTTLGSVIESPFGTLLIKNSTITSNKSQNFITNYPGTYITLINNSIVGNVATTEKDFPAGVYDVNLLGNIIVGNSFGVANPEDCASYLYNISEKEIASDKVSFLYEGTYDETNGVFSPVVKNNGGITSTIALRTDKLPDGTSIRFPLNETVVTEDQRGVARLENTCMGAFEYVCSGNIYESSDTINLGESYTFQGEEVGKSITRAGVYHYLDTLKALDGCDSIISFTLAVRPEFLENGYYVKVNGTGNGENWEEAMSAGMFDTLLPLFEDGAVVYLAEGDYKTSAYAFEINSSISLIGGFPADATTGDESQPEKYTTSLLGYGSLKNDVISLYPLSFDPYSFNHFEDNKTSVVNIRGERNVEMFGITVQGAYACDSGAINMERAKLKLDRCVLQKNVASAIKAGKGSEVEITDSYFTLNFGAQGGVFNFDGAKLDVKRSLFEKNLATHSDCGLDSIGGVAYLNNSTANIENSTFTGNMATKGAVFAINNSEFNLTNTTIVGNVYVKGDNQGCVIYSDDKSVVNLFANMIVGNSSDYFSPNMTEMANVQSDYNIVDEDLLWKKGANDMKMEKDEIVNMLDAESFAEGVSPNLSDAGGYTKVIAVLASDFSGGKVISVDKEAKRVEVDQRGFLRKDTSCVGAYEFPTSLDYYVKTRPQGDGTGRDWANAMGDTTFAKYFSVVPTNATFHVAEGLYHAYNSRRAYISTRTLNVVGSYPPDAQEGAVADASKYTTTLSADMNDDDVYELSKNNDAMFSVSNRRDNDSRVMSIDSRMAGTVKLYGLRFVGSYMGTRNTTAALSLNGVYGKKLSVELDSCEFVYNYTAITSTIDTLILKSCRFDTLSKFGISHSKYGDQTCFLVDDCSFTNVLNAFTIRDFYGNLRISNSTFNNVSQVLESFAYHPSGENANTRSKLFMYNNTVFDTNSSFNDINFPEFTDILLKGNVFSAGMLLNGKGIPSEENPIVSDYNLYIGNPDTIGQAFAFGEHDILVEPKEVDGVISGSLKENKFIATSQKMNDEDITCVVELLKDKLATGEYIRLPKEESIVNNDQLGSARHSMSCMGAYEIDCKPDTFFYFDTIQIGNQFRGVVYDTVGNYNIMGEDSVNVVGCPLTVLHKLYVTPSFEGKGYYVKTERTGRGTGMDWENAMNGADMVYGITQVPDNAVFHVAQGDYSLDQLSGSSVVEAPHAFSIIGGYKRNPKLGDVPNVDNKTMLVSDNLDFIIEVKEQDSDVSATTTVGFYNLYLNNVSLTGAVGRDVNLDSCSVRSEKPVLSLSGANNVKIKDVSFDGLSGTNVCMIVDSTASVRIESSSFSNYKGAISAIDLNGDLKVVNSTFAGNNSHELIKCTHVNGVTYLYNNTIAGNNVEETLLSLREAIVKGNIIMGNGSYSLDVADGSEVAYNVLPSSYTDGDETNVKLSDAELPLYLDGSLDATTHIFTANLKDNGGFTPTIALLTDSFPDHSLARFEKKNTVVDYDQRGVPRLEFLCYGAYELYDGVRDTITIQVDDSICLGTDYEFGALTLKTADMPDGADSTYAYFVRGVLTTDTIYQLNLHVVPSVLIRLDNVMASPTLCHGSGNGAFKFSASTMRKGSMRVSIFDAANGEVSDESTDLTVNYQRNELPLGKYTAVLTSLTSCVVDTSFAFEITDRDPLQAEECADTLLTTCANEPNSQLTIPLRGFHSSTRFYLNDEEIGSPSQNANAYLEYDSDADFTAKAFVKLSSLSLGDYSLTAVDYCGNEYELKDFTVSMAQDFAIGLDLIDYRQDSLKCGLDLAYAKFKVKSGRLSTFTLFSDNGYNYSKSFSETDTVLSFTDLPRGDYQASLVKMDGCSDSIAATFSIKSQEPILQSLTVNGVLCADANIKVDAQGGRGEYVYHWTYPDGTKHDLDKGVLTDANAGIYICVVEDADGCLSEPDTAQLKSDKELSSFEVESVNFRNITCMSGHNGMIIAQITSKEPKNAVTLCVTNEKTKAVSKVTSSNQRSLLSIDTLSAGTYTYEIYYGTESCRLDTNGVKGSFEIFGKSTEFKLDQLVVTAPQTCLSAPDAVVQTNAKGWETDFQSYLCNVESKDSSYLVVQELFEGGNLHYTIPELTGGSYLFKVYDACGSSVVSDTLRLPVYDAYELTEIDHTDSLLCAKEKSGVITFSVKGGIPSVSVPSINGRNLVHSDTITETALGQGVYRISYGTSRLENCPGDLVYEDVKIAGPDTLSINYLLTGNCPSSTLSAKVTGECGKYTYVWKYGVLSQEGDTVMPFTINKGDKYSLTVSDTNHCDTYTKEIVIPDASDMPSLSLKITPEAQLCHNKDNGSLIIYPSLSKPLDFTVVSTVSYSLEGSDEVVSTQCELNPNDTLRVLYCLKPGVYNASVRLGDFDCDMGVDPAYATARVDTLGVLQFASDFTTSPMTCLSANGTSKFDVSGWMYTHTLDYYEAGTDKVGGALKVDPETNVNYVGSFLLDSLYGKTYEVHVSDVCGNKIEGKFTVDQFVPSVNLHSAVDLTCYLPANGAFDCEIKGWTPKHTAYLTAEGHNYFDVNSPNFSLDTIDGQPVASYHAEGLHIGSWTLAVMNECEEILKDKIEVKGFDYYAIALDEPSSNIHLKCPYDTNGVISLKVLGGYPEASFSGNATREVEYQKIIGYADSFFSVPDTFYSYVAVIDSLSPEIIVDTTYKYLSLDSMKVKQTYTIEDIVSVPDGNGGFFDSLVYTFKDTLVDSFFAVYDTIVTSTVSYNQKIDDEGHLVFDSILQIGYVLKKMSYPIFGSEAVIESSPIMFGDFKPSAADVITGAYRFDNLRSGTYHFVYKSELEGCQDSVSLDLLVDKPDPVYLRSDVMPISCSSSTDGVISVAPRRHEISYPFFIGRNQEDFSYNKLYTVGKDPSTGADAIVEYKANGVAQRYMIDQLYDQSDFVSVKWSYRDADKNWKAMENIIFPDSTDDMEEAYYKNGEVVNTPVYSNSHLDPFWIDGMGDWFDVNVVTVANLAPGNYAVLVEDRNACQYYDTFEVKLPASALKIDSVIFNGDKAECDPKERQILTYASGGWGSYKFMFNSDVKVESNGKFSDGYRGGEATHYDPETMTGWGVSPLLQPGLYTVVVMDEQGCMVTSDQKYSVKTKFKLHIDSTQTICPEDVSAPVQIVFDEKPAYNSYDVVEYDSDCRRDTLDDCRDHSYTTLGTGLNPVETSGVFSIPANLSAEKLTCKTHGVFVYATDDSERCGTYVKGTVCDTIPIFKASRRSVQPVSCNGMNDGKIELYVSGGSAPYRVIRNSAWHADDVLEMFDNRPLVCVDTVVHLINPNDMTAEDGSLKYRDTTIQQCYLVVGDKMSAGDYYFTVVDNANCRSIVGSPETYDDKLVIKEPEPLTAVFDASNVCPAESDTKGGNVYFKDVKGGTAPYTFTLNHLRADSLVVNADPISVIYGGDVDSRIYMKVTDVNNCYVEDTIKFRNDDLPVDTFDFWATSWYEFGDVVALIDVCGPESTFDSVSYTFYKDGVVDPRVKILDKRMYIYNLDGNPEARDLLYKAKDTKTEVPDAYFSQNFKLRSDVSLGQSRHVTFFKYEDSSIDMSEIKENKTDIRKALAGHTVTMKAYFLGCEYHVDRNGLMDTINLINPNNPPKIDPIGQAEQIISLTGSPNPFKNDIVIEAHFTARMDATLYIYNIDGRMTTPIQIKASDLEADDDEFVFKKGYKTTDLFSGNEETGYIILFLKTARDQKSAVLIHQDYLQSFDD